MELEFSLLPTAECYQKMILDTSTNTNSFDVYIVAYQWKEQVAPFVIDHTGLDKEVAGVLTLVYDHHTSDLAQRLIETQHEQHGVILSSMHVHLDHHNCLEALVHKGPGEAVQRLSQKLISTRGVKYGKLTLATTGQEIV